MVIYNEVVCTIKRNIANNATRWCRKLEVRTSTLLAVLKDTS